MNGILVHYGELALKGGNRSKFEKILRDNIEKKAGGRALSQEGRIFCENTDIKMLAYVFGISWYSECIKVTKNIETIISTVKQEVSSKLEGVNSFAVYVKRSDKRFEYNSVEVAKIVGKEIIDEFNLKVDLNNPDLPIYIEIADHVFIHFNKIKGLGGLPMGVSGKLLSLLSGGIDSPVASNQMMKRGCELDFIHFHAFPDNYDFSDTKIISFIKILKRYQNNNTLYLVPYNHFQLALLKNKIIESYELVMFRRFMVKLSERIATENNYMGIVLGDNLGQVASQTLENLYAARFDCKVPIYQPLISYDKDDIIKKSRDLGTFEISIKPYKECCSLVSNSPKTKAKLETVLHYSDKLDFDELIEITLASVRTISI